MDQNDSASLGSLETLLRDASTHGVPPVERWNPPYCGDIGLAIRRDGTWLYQKSPIGRMALVKLFASVLRREADGRHYLVTPIEKVDVAVEDAPFLAVAMAIEGQGRDQRITFRTNVDDIVACDPGRPLRFEKASPDGGYKPYVTVRGRLEALITRALYYDLMDLAIATAAGAGGRPGIWSGGAFFPLEPD